MLAVNDDDRDAGLHRPRRARLHPPPAFRRSLAAAGVVHSAWRRGSRERRDPRRWRSCLLGATVAVYLERMRLYERRLLRACSRRFASGPAGSLLMPWTRSSGADCQHGSTLHLLFDRGERGSIHHVRSDQPGIWSAPRPVVEGSDGSWVRGSIHDDACCNPVYGFVYDAVAGWVWASIATWRYRRSRRHGSLKRSMRSCQERSCNSARVGRGLCSGNIPAVRKLPRGW